MACSRHDASPAIGARSPASGTRTSLPPQAVADSVLSRYLALVVERDGFSPGQFAGIYSDATPCVEEEYGDGRSSYWLARGRVLGYTPDADTLHARIELLTVAAQQPRADSAYGSVVTARIRTDTLVLKLVPDSVRRSWQTCGLLSNGFALGGYGRPENTRFDPPSTTRAQLLAQVDSIKRAHSPR